MNKRIIYLCALTVFIILTTGIMTVYATEETGIVAGWQQDQYGRWYQNPDGTFPANSWQWIDGAWYCFDEYGYTRTGWVFDDAWYYFDQEGFLQTGWMTDASGTYYLGATGVMQTGWVQDQGQWYYFGTDGLMRTGWVFDDAWYYLLPSGEMKTGWLCDNGFWYFLGASGVMQTGWVFDGAWYYLKSDGTMATGWVFDGNDWYFMSENGVMQTGWLTDGSTNYYLGASGAMQTGWVWDNGSWYFMDDSGAMHIGWLLDNQCWYYMDLNGMMMTGSQVIDGEEYIFDESGVANIEVLPEFDGVTLTEDIYYYMKDLVADVTTSDMTPSEKLWATFNYIADRNVYPYMQNRIPYYRGNDWPVVYAHDMMYLGGSYCHGYSSLFGYAAALCGFDNVHWAQNGFHAWVDVDGLVYDPVFRDSSYNTLVYGWTYETAIANNGNLGAGFDYPASEGSWQFIKVPEF